MLLSAHVFTLCGYSFIYDYLVHKADKSLVQKLDNNQYDEADLITIKVPMNLPYTYDRNQFERCDGTININGIFYNYVRRKLINDTLVLQCIPNSEKNKLYAEKNEYTKIAGNKQSSSSDSNAVSTLSKLFFLKQNSRTGNDFSVIVLTESYALSANDGTVRAPFITPPGKPPETV